MSKTIILASGSPRRKELLGLADVQIEIISPDINEDLKKGEKPVVMVKRLAFEKAREVARLIQAQKRSGIILAADTTVVSYKNEILGKPSSKNEAYEMISDLQGRAHFVFTGYSLLSIARGVIKAKVVKSVRTRVFIRSQPKRDPRLCCKRRKHGQSGQLRCSRIWNGHY